MISKTIGFRGTQHFQTHPSVPEGIQVGRTSVLSRFPAVHRPLLTYVNTAFVAPAIGHQVDHMGHELSGDQTRCGSEEVIHHDTFQLIHRETGVGFG